jgi:hypothetical protein
MGFNNSTTEGMYMSKALGNSSNAYFLARNLKIKMQKATTLCGVLY